MRTQIFRCQIRSSKHEARNEIQNPKPQDSELLFDLVPLFGDLPYRFRNFGLIAQQACEVGLLENKQIAVILGPDGRGSWLGHEERNLPEEASFIQGAEHFALVPQHLHVTPADEIHLFAHIPLPNDVFPVREDHLEGPPIVLKGL